MSIDADHEGPNEAVEKVPTRKKVSELGVPKWSPDPRSSRIANMEVVFVINFSLYFFYRLNVSLTGARLLTLRVEQMVRA